MSTKWRKVEVEELAAIADQMAVDEERQRLAAERAERHAVHEQVERIGARFGEGVGRLSRDRGAAHEYLTGMLVVVAVHRTKRVHFRLGQIVLARLDGRFQVEVIDEAKHRVDTLTVARWEIVAIDGAPTREAGQWGYRGLLG